MKRPTTLKGYHLEITFESRPKGLFDPCETFKLNSVRTPVAPYPVGYVLVRVLYTSVDPTMRVWMREKASYLPPLKIGGVMRAGCVGEIIGVGEGVSRVNVGDVVLARLGWREYALVKQEEVAVVKVGKMAEKKGLGVLLGGLGMTGLTAYFGLIDVGSVKRGDVVVVSGAAGATGSMACQIAKHIYGCKVVGIAGGEKKCNWLKNELCVDEVIDYKKGQQWFGLELKRVCKDGVDVYFDNVGGWMLNSMIRSVKQGARIVLCGAISTYNEGSSASEAPDKINITSGTFIVKRLRMQGFIITDYIAKFAAARSEMEKWMEEGKIKTEEQIVDGLEMAPDALLMLFKGQNTGKLLVKVAERGGKKVLLHEEAKL